MRLNNDSKPHDLKTFFAPVWAAVSPRGEIVFVVGNFRPMDIIVTDNKKYIIAGPAPMPGETENKYMIVLRDYRLNKTDTSYAKRLLTSCCDKITRDSLRKVKDFQPAILRFKVLSRMYDSPRNTIYAITGGEGSDQWVIYALVKKKNGYIATRLDEGAEYIGYGWFRWFNKNILRFVLVQSMPVEREIYGPSLKIYDENLHIYANIPNETVI